jgi:HlyD family secretion protein
MKSFTLRIILALVSIAGFSTMTVACSSPTSNTAQLPSRSTPSQVAAETASTVRAIGTLVSANQATLAFQTAGRIKQINVKEGDTVHAGDLLISLDTTMLDLQVAQAQAALETAQARFDQLKNPSVSDVTAAQANVAAAEAMFAQLKSPTVNDLKIAKADLDSAQAALANAQSAYDRIGGDTNPFGAMSPQALALQQASNNYQKALAAYNAKTNPSDAQLKQAQAAIEQARAQLNRLTNPNPNDVKTAQAAVAQAQAALDLAKQNVTNAKIVAPFDGTVVWLGPHLGESAAPNAPMVTLADLSRMQVQIGVDENTVAQLKVGQSATITADALPGKTLTGHVSKIGLLATTTAGIINLPVTIDVDAGNVPITPGLSATIEINTGK